MAAKTCFKRNFIIDQNLANRKNKIGKVLLLPKGCQKFLTLKYAQKSSQLLKNGILGRRQAAIIHEFSKKVL
jgi:hypothetical protein